MTLGKHGQENGDGICGANSKGMQKIRGLRDAAGELAKAQCLRGFVALAGEQEFKRSIVREARCAFHEKCVAVGVREASMARRGLECLDTRQGVQ